MDRKTRIILQCVNAPDDGVKYTEMRRAIQDKSENICLVQNVPESTRLPLAKNNVVDSFINQWTNTVYKDLTRYEQFKFKQAITELLQEERDACQALFTVTK